MAIFFGWQTPKEENAIAVGRHRIDCVRLADTVSVCGWQTLDIPKKQRKRREQTLRFPDTMERADIRIVVATRKHSNVF